jgi:ATP-dependent RNA helicase DDX54/DBP10
MGLSHEVWKGVIKKDSPPDQGWEGRKTIFSPAMTGSGKTAAFLIPMFERLKVRMALQILCKELERFTGLTYSCVLGGDACNGETICSYSNNLRCSVRYSWEICPHLHRDESEYVVFDEADSLFEMDGSGVPVEGDPGQVALHQADGPVLCHTIQDVG